MKRIISFIVAILLVCSNMVLFGYRYTDSAYATQTDHLVIYNWAEYMYTDDENDDSPDFERDFKEYYMGITGNDIEITYSTYDTNETMLTRVENNDAHVDIICPSEYAIQRLIEGGYLCKLNYHNDTANQYLFESNINADIITKINSNAVFSSLELADYLVPYTYGTLGILYNKDALDEMGVDVEQYGWGLLWNTDSQGNTIDRRLEKTIYMKDSMRDAYVAGVMYLKYQHRLPAPYDTMSAEVLINNSDQELIALVKEVLIEQKSHFYGYEVDEAKMEIAQPDSKVLINLAWSGDAMYAIELAAEEGINLAYFTPDIGANIWFDGWVMLKNAVNVQPAKIFIDWLNSPQVAMKNMMYIGYTSAVDKDILSVNEPALNIYFDTYEISEEDEVTATADFFGNSNRYPDILNINYGMMSNFSKEGNNALTTMWMEVKASGLSTWVIIVIIVGAVVVLCAVVLIVYKLKNGKKAVIVEE
ncbi:MAG: extracellular solute-binding protein [Clostridia bacterium]|nr:extracellular solute-binding protein [Clostridia bacterium]